MKIERDSISQKNERKEISAKAMADLEGISELLSIDPREAAKTSESFESDYSFPYFELCRTIC